MTRSDKKNTICERCGHKCATPQKLRDHLNRKFKCNPLPRAQHVSEGSKGALKEQESPLPKVHSTPVVPMSEAKVPGKDIPFKNQYIETKYKRLKRQLGTFENLQQETGLTPDTFDRKQFYLEMEKEAIRPWTGMISNSKWRIFLYSAIQSLQRDFGKESLVQRLEVIDEIRKEIFPESPDRLYKKGAKEQEIREEENRRQNALQLIPCVPKKTRRAPKKQKKQEPVHQLEQVEFNVNDRKPGEHFKVWAKRLHKRWKELDIGDHPLPQNLDECETLHHDLLQYDPEAWKPLPAPALKERPEGNSESPESAGAKKLEFREQDLGIAVKRRAIAVHNTKVPKSHPDNGSDIRKMLESQRNQFKELLEKEFDKRGQFKFALCSLIKFLIDDKPTPAPAPKERPEGNSERPKGAEGHSEEAEKQKNSRIDWLRNKQIIVYNRAEINDYLSAAFEQILYQVEERGGKSANA